MKISQPRSVASLTFVFLAASTAAVGQFKTVGPPPYTAAVARQKIKALLAKVDPANRQQSIETISGLLNWYRDIADEELIAVWKKDEGRQNLPDVIAALADARVATQVVEFSWRQQRQATFQLADATMFGTLMLRFPDSSKPFLDDLLGSVGSAAGPASLDLSETEAYTVCRILLDMPDIRDWKKIALQILPRYRDIAENLLAADVNEGNEEKRKRALYWTADLRASASRVAADPGPRKVMQPDSPSPSRMPVLGATTAPTLSAAGREEKSGTLECSGAPIPPNGEYIFRNVPTANRRFEFDRKIWDVTLVPGEGDTKDMIFKNKSSSAQKRCVVRWSITP